MRRALRALVCAVLVAAPVVALTQPAYGAPETPAQRCERETQMYNDAWESSWLSAHPGDPGPVPPPPAPYTCYDPGPEPENEPFDPTDPVDPGADSGEGLVTETNPDANSPLTVQPNLNGPIVVPRQRQPAPAGPAESGVLSVPDAEQVVPAESESVLEGQEADTLEEEAARRSLEEVLADCTPDLIPGGADRTALTPAQVQAYDILRKAAPKPGNRQRVTDDVAAGKYGDQYVNTPKRNWQADHVVSLNRLIQIPGFMQLPLEKQIEIADSRENLRPLYSQWNGSKQQKSIGDWEGPITTPNPVFSDEDRKLLCLYEREAQLAILQALAEYWFNQALQTAIPGAGQPSSPAPPSPETREVAPSADPSAEPSVQPTAYPEIPYTTQPEIFTEQVVPEVTTQVEPEFPDTSVVEIPVTTVQEIPVTTAAPAPTTSAMPLSSAAPTAPPTEITTSVPAQTSLPSPSAPPAAPRASSPPSVSKPPAKPAEPEDDDELSTWEKVGIGAAVAGVGVLVVVQPQIGIPLAVGGAAMAAS